MGAKKPVRVIINTRPFLFKKTGIGYYTYNLFNGLKQSGEVDVYPTIDKSSTTVLRFMSGISQSVRKVLGDSVLKISVPFGDLLIGKRERKNSITDADIYHEPNYDVIPPGRWRSVATIHDLAFLKYPEYLPEAVLLKCRANIGNILKADRFIVTTGTVRGELVDAYGFPERRIDVIPLAPSGNYYPVNKEQKEGIKNIRRYSGGGDYILYVGTIEPRKNIKTLLKAFRVVRERLKVKLILAGGKGWKYDDIIKMPQKLGIQKDVVFTGYVDEKTILYLYNYSSVVVYPSIYEGFGLPVVEAMSCGAPVVISDIPSLREVAGKATLSFNPWDHEELADKIEQILTSTGLSKELRIKGLQRSKEYSWDKTVSSTIHSYKRVLEE